MRIVLAVCLAACVTLPAAAQQAGDFGASGPKPPGHGRGRHDGDAPTAAHPAGPAPKADPRQRVDPGAVMCTTQADLEQHERAIQARLDGREALEPVGCHIVRAMTPVAVVDRQGLAMTKVRLPGALEQFGWTDAIVRDAPASK